METQLSAFIVFILVSFPSLVLLTLCPFIIGLCLISKVNLSYLGKNVYWIRLVEFCLQLYSVQFPPTVSQTVNGPKSTENDPTCHYHDIDGIPFCVTDKLEFATK